LQATAAIFQVGKSQVAMLALRAQTAGDIEFLGACGQAVEVSQDNGNLAIALSLGGIGFEASLLDGG